MRDQAEFLRGVRLATDHLFAQRKNLRKVAVRIGFWPEGLVISARPSTFDDGEDLQPEVRAARLAAFNQEVIPWDRLQGMDPAALIEVVDRVCRPAHDLLKGAA